jgi:hypothetical protein
MKFDTFKKNIAKDVYNQILNEGKGEITLLRARLTMLGVSYPHNTEVRKEAANMAYDIVMRWDARSWSSLKRFTNRNYNRFKQIELTDKGWELC